MRLHPDKCKLPGAGEAMRIMLTAKDRVEKEMNGERYYTDGAPQAEAEVEQTILNALIGNVSIETEKDTWLK